MFHHLLAPKSNEIEINCCNSGQNFGEQFLFVSPPTSFGFVRITVSQKFLLISVSRAETSPFHLSNYFQKYKIKVF